MDLVRAQLERREVRETLLKKARRYMPQEADAQDLVQDALVLAIDPERSPWDPTKPSFYVHMTLLMRRIAVQKHWEAAHIVFDSEIAHDEALSDPDPLADEALDRRRTIEWLRRLALELRAAISDNEMAVRTLDWICQGVEGHSDLAARVGCEVEDIYRIFELLKYHGKKIRSADLKAEAERMAQARQTATKKKAES
jgi:hypothetical protein